MPQELRDKWAQEQQIIKSKIVDKDVHPWDVDNLDLVCGVDLSAKKDNPDIACVCLVVYSLKEKTVKYIDSEVVLINQPYIPGFLAFREIPPLMHLFDKLKNSGNIWPELIIVDGNGILHSNQCGLACHLGVLLNTPTVGVGKTFFNVDGLEKMAVKKMCQEKLHN